MRCSKRAAFGTAHLGQASVAGTRVGVEVASAAEGDAPVGALESWLRGRSSVGRALASQARCRGFESHRPLRDSPEPKSPV